MPWEIKQSGDEYCVHKQGQSSPILGGCHPSKAEAEDHMAALYASERAFHAYERLLSESDAPHPGAMIAFLLDSDTKQALIDACAPLDVAPDHCTLLYLGPDAAALDAHKSELIRWIADIACYTAPIEGAVNGYGRFAASEGEDTTALYANVDCPELAHFRERLYQATCMAGCELPDAHGFTPHITLAYLSAGDATPDLTMPLIPLRFASFALVWGAETITFPLTEAMPMPDEYRAAHNSAGQYLRGYCERAAAKGGKMGESIRFIASTENVARDGMVIEAAGWELENYRKNPVVLWSHDIIGARPPIGRADVRVEGRALIADITFDQDDSFAVDVERKYRAGYLHGVSVRWDPKEMAPTRAGQPPRFIRQDLLEISAVTVPSDPGALKQRQLRALQDELAALQNETATDSPAPDWPEVASAMAALILFPTSRPGREWRKEYHRLARFYDQLGKEPPERLAPDYLAALDIDAVSGLFLEDEKDVAPDLFAARAAQSAPHALTAADRADLAQACERIQALLARCAESEPTETTQVEPPETAQDAADPLLLNLASILGARHAHD